MATVFRARDLKHDRTVAIKVLKPELAEAIGSDRFLREIRTTANLSHPHILPLFDSGEADGFLFYVMPFVKGESLRDRLEREGQLPVEDAVQIAREVAEALAYAHKNAVIHRDIKPANIMLDEGHALLADFGIAQAKAGAEETKLTGSGMSLGTPSYMSPEQIAGDKEVDGRADQYALGCVLFEMLAGRPPFTGADVQTVMRQHLAVDAPGLTGARATVPKGVAKAAHRALAKAPADRFRTMGEFEKALAGATLPLLARVPMGRARTVIYAGTVILGLATVAVFAAVWPQRAVEVPELVPNRVVVMPFENRTGDEALNELAVMVADYVGQAMQQVESVDPVSVTAARQVAEEAAIAGLGNVLSVVADSFHAALAVTGAIFVIGDSLRYRLEVSEVATGRPLQPVEEMESLDSLGASIGTLGERVAGALARELDPYMEQGAQALPTPPRLEALRRYKLGYEAIERGDLEEAMEQFLAAYELDTLFVSPLVIGSRVAWVAWDDARADSLTRFVELRRHLLGRLGQLQLDEQSAIRAHDRDAVLRATREMAKIDSLGFSPINYAIAARVLNFPREAIEALRAYDPTPEWRRGEVRYYWLPLAIARHMLGEHEQELVDVRRGREQLPTNSDLLDLEVAALAALHRPEEVDSLLDQAAAIFPDRYGAMLGAGRELRAHGDPEAARATFDRGVEWLRERPPEEVDRASYQPRMASMLYGAERWEEAHAIYRALAEEQPDNLVFLGMEGRSAARMGDTASAREISARIAEMPWQEHDYEHYYVRGILAALLSQPDEALRLIREAFERGKPFGLGLHQESDLESLHQREDWQEFIRPKG